MSRPFSNSVLLTQYLSQDNFYSTDALSSVALEKSTEKRVMSIFRHTVDHVVAYQHVIAQENTDSNTVTSLQEYRTLPVLTKKNYILKYPLTQRISIDLQKQGQVIASSSGTTGESLFWPRSVSHEIEGALAHEFIFDHVLQIGKRPTLFINGFAMGNWIAGMFTHACVNLLLWKGYPLTVMSPGYSIEAVLEVLRVVAPQFSQVVLTGHTPFLKEVIDAADANRIDLQSFELQLLGTGQAITEDWRRYMQNKVGSQTTRGFFYNLYGSADAALMGFETPESVEVRKFFSQNPDVAKEFFQCTRLPSLYQFDPRLTYFEEVGGELVITKDGGCPLVRYNIQDEGGVFSREKLADFLKKHGQTSLLHSVGNALPFVYLYGREKFMVKLYGANIHAEHVQHALEHQSIIEQLTGRFTLETEFDDDQNPRLICRVEANFTTTITPELADHIQAVFVERVRQINSEYDFLLKTLDHKVKPKIVLHDHGDPQYFPLGKVKKTS